MGKKKKVTLKVVADCVMMFLPHLNIICDLLLNLTWKSLILEWNLTTKANLVNSLVNIFVLKFIEKIWDKTFYCPARHYLITFAFKFWSFLPGLYIFVNIFQESWLISTALRRTKGYTEAKATLGGSGSHTLVQLFWKYPRDKFPPSSTQLAIKFAPMYQYCWTSISWINMYLDVE